MGIKHWIVPPKREEEALALSRSTGLSPLLCRILLGRGCDTPQAVEELVRWDVPLSDPCAIRDMDKAVLRIRRALEEGERIAVFGDFDCDGITSTALLTGYLQAVGADVIYYVPAREKEGYGMSKEAVDALCAQEVSLIITVDNGISSHEEIAHAAALGIDVIVTDHHTPRETLPPAVAVLDAHRADDTSGLTQLSGAGIAFKLVCALEDDPTGAEMLEYYADLAAIGTVADVVPLIGENRAIVRHGLNHIAQTERAGIAALLEVCGLEDKTLSADHIAFAIAPRLNASGRMGTVDEAIDLLLTDDIPYAREIAQAVDGQNALRKQTEDDVVAQIEQMLTDDPGLLRERLLLVAGEGWHHGVVGIVASKMMERTGKPTIIFATEGDDARGSARSLPGFSIIQAVSECSEHLSRYGGHPLAAGMSLPKEKLPVFMEQLQAWAREHHPIMPLPRLEIDCVLSPRELGVENIEALSALEPFGAGNRPPLFLFAGMTVSGTYPTADGRHVRVALVGDGSSFTAIYFRMSAESFPYIPGDVVDLVASVTASPWNGKMQVSVIIRDVRRAGIPQRPLLLSSQQYACHLRGEYTSCSPEELAPSREEMAAVYRYLRGSDGFLFESEQLYYRLADSGVTYAKMMVALDVLEEMGLLTRKDDQGRTGYFCVANPPKVNLEDSAILLRLKGVAVAP